MGVECNGIEFDYNVDSENEIFENENENDYYGLYYPITYATTHSTPRLSTTTINFNNTDLELCEKFILDGVYGCNMYGIYQFEYEFIENFYNNGYYYQLLFSTPTSTSTHTCYL